MECVSSMYVVSTRTVYTVTGIPQLFYCISNMFFSQLGHC